MLGSIPRISNATEKFGNWAEKLTAAKSAIFSKTDEADAELNFQFTRPLSKDVKHGSKEKSAEAAQDVSGERTHFLNSYFKEKILNTWEVHGDADPSNDFSDLINAEKPEFDEDPVSPPLLLGFSKDRDYVEVEYMVVGDPETGDCLTPEISVYPSKDGKSGDVYLNGKLVACISGGTNLQAEDIKLVKVEV